nr:MAG TPA: hypothetical protein [Caudoviricetes sp.]
MFSLRYANIQISPIFCCFNFLPYLCIRNKQQAKAKQS